MPGVRRTGHEPMGDTWYRRTSWSDLDRRAFFDRLARSRTRGNKAQYLRIQAVHLEETGRPALVRAALELLDMVVREWPEPSEVAQAYHQQATCHLQLREPLLAVQS